MHTTTNLKTLIERCNWFFIAQIDFGNVKTYNRARDVWDSGDFGKWHGEVRRCAREILVSHNHVVNDVIIDCLQQEYRALELTISHLNSLYKKVSGISQLDNTTREFIQLTDKKQVVDWFVSDLKEISHLLNIEVDIKAIVKERTKHDENLKRVLCL